MNTARILWILWSLGWFGFWAIFGWFAFPFNIILAILSVAAIAIPVGKQQKHIGSHSKPSIPSSRYDTRFTHDELENFFKDE